MSINIQYVAPHRIPLRAYRGCPIGCSSVRDNIKIKEVLYDEKK